ncbi:receptor-like protein 48 [Raphanus sativus]|uniref:Receptor-like protein 48 n=1 Tax=Raphanus sativus TaxID=3726 RepID=A0A9W3DSS1_RAPSA|nr:receptor-like protein 48 [Raphanus sativus]
MHSRSERKMILWSSCLIFSLSYSILVFSSPPANHLCRPDQRDALWEFKSEFHFSGIAPNEKKQKWLNNNTDCCFWDGVSCDLKTGNVIGLNLWGSSLNGSLRSNSGLFKLQHLQSLNLSSNNLAGTLPDSIGDLRHLRVLKLYGCGFFGKIPSSIGNLSQLTHLDLEGNGFTGELPETMAKLNKLTKLLLSTSELTGNFHHALLNLSELTWLDLRNNHLEGTLPSNMSRLSKLEHFDIGSNSMTGTIPTSLFMIPSLVLLNLEKNSFTGPLKIGNNISSSSPYKLDTLTLGGNSLNGPIPVGFISKLVRLSYLDLSYWNTMKGAVDFSSFLRLKSLVLLDLSYLNTRSKFELNLFSKLVSLAVLDLSGNSLKISSSLHLPSPIGSLSLALCNISEFPNFLRTQTNLYYLDISANRIEGRVPDWLWRLSGLLYVDISKNYLTGFDGLIQTSPIEMLDISSNAFQDPFPLLPNSTRFFSASDNRFSGEIPTTICGLISLDTLLLSRPALLLSNNGFNGSIPRCFESFNTKLSLLHLRNNNLSGLFPEESIGAGLVSLDVGGNQLSGELPRSLINCTLLEFLNVEDNMFSDTFPFWLSSLPDLQFLVIRSNKFHGPVYSLRGGSLSFPKLRIFDISGNIFTGVLPLDYFAGWSAMTSDAYVTDDKQGRFMGISFSNYHKSVVLAIKGSEMELLGSGFRMYKTIDVSGNRLEGDIPRSIGLLKGLIVLNMSNNALTGRIPPSLSNLTSLQSLDLSENRFFGSIPQELGKLSFLALMNFSNNMLEGPIPQGTQIQSQNSSSFAENPGLCGAPLQETCGGGEEVYEVKEDNDQVLSWIAVAIAYVPGVLCGLTIGHVLSLYKPDWFMRIFHSFA